MDGNLQQANPWLGTMFYVAAFGLTFGALIALAGSLWIGGWLGGVGIMSGMLGVAVKAVRWETPETRELRMLQRAYYEERLGSDEDQPA